MLTGLLHVGDIIKEINGIDVTNDPDALQEHMKSAQGNVTLKILPSYKDHIPAPPVSLIIRLLVLYAYPVIAILCLTSRTTVTSARI